MDPSTRRSAAHLAVLLLLALLIGGCADQTAPSTAASTAASTTTVAPTTTTVPPLDAEELAWLEGLSGVRTKVEKSYEAIGSGQVTRAILVESSNRLAAWSRQLRRMGAPSDRRLQPAYTLVRRVIRTYDKGAKCYAKAARVVSAGGVVVGGTPEARIMNEAMDCASAAEGNGTNLLYKAEAKGKELKAKYG
jgi:hypothetical protein